MKFAIITSCSKLKLLKPIQAQELYQGQFFRSVRKFTNSLPGNLFILSAKYGLISGTQIIEPYEQRIQNKKDVIRLKSTLSPLIDSIIQDFDVIIVLMGSEYQSVLSAFQNNPKFLFSKDNRGSGGYLQLLTQLNAFSKNDAMAYFDYCQYIHANISVETIEEYKKFAQSFEK